MFPGRESELFYNDSSESPRDHSFPAMCSSEMSSAACVGSLKGIAAGQLQLHWLRNPEMWVKTVSAAVTFDPLLQGGGGSRRLQVRALDRRASQQMVAPTNHRPSGSLRGLLPQLDDVYLCQDSCERIYLCVVLGPHPEGQLQWE